MKQEGRRGGNPQRKGKERARRRGGGKRTIQPVDETKRGHRLETKRYTQRASGWHPEPGAERN